MKGTSFSPLYSPALMNYLEERSGLGLVLIDGEGTIIACNDGFRTLLGLEEKPVGIKITTLMAGDSPPLPFPVDGHVNLPLTFTAPSGVDLFLNCCILPANSSFIMALEQNRLTHNELIAKMSKLNNQIVDITRELEKKNAALSQALKTIKRIMNIDPLTGLLNRRAFMPLLKKHLALMRRHRLPLSVIMTDIDHFKTVNDTYGHKVGDVVLKRFAQLLQKGTRQEDIVGRFGGEEFILVLPHTPANAAWETAERIRTKLANTKIRELKKNITASFGIAESTAVDDEKSIIKRADDALYAAKGGGRNRCVVM
ncbi:MAG: sensor domain-containing diguanylate cyclase [Syntrophales bacterium]|nr:sensor domain-containing diguanylate cyclase [Syntrophales bacterium]